MTFFLTSAKNNSQYPCICTMPGYQTPLKLANLQITRPSHRINNTGIPAHKTCRAAKEASLQNYAQDIEE